MLLRFTNWIGVSNLVMILLITCPAYSEDIGELNAIDCNRSSFTSQLKDLSNISCRSEFEVLKCDQFFESPEDKKEFGRTCPTDTEQPLNYFDAALSCGSQIIEPLKDSAKAVIKFFASEIKATKENREKFITQCQTSTAFKSAIAKSIPIFSDSDQTELNQIPCTYLIVELEDFAMRERDYQRNDKVKTAYEKFLKTSKNIDFSQPDMAFNPILSFIHHNKEKWACLNRAGRLLALFSRTKQGGRATTEAVRSGVVESRTIQPEFAKPTTQSLAQSHFGDIDLVVDNYVMRTTGTGAKTVKLPESYASGSKPLRQGKISDIPASNRQAELDKLFPGGRDRLEAVDKTSKPQALFFRTISEEQMDELLRTGQLMPVSASSPIKNVNETLAELRRVFIEPDYKVLFTEQHADKVIDQLRTQKILELPPSPERDRQFLKIVGHDNWAAIHGQGLPKIMLPDGKGGWVEVIQPLKQLNSAQSFSLGPHYSPSQKNYVVVAEDKRQRGMRIDNASGDQEGEWLFWGGIGKDDIVRVLTPDEFARLYGNARQFRQAR